MLRSSTPIILAAVAGLFAIRAGVFRVVMEGLALAAAFVVVAAGAMAESVWIGLALFALYRVLVDRLKADTVVAGLGLTAVCVGGTAFLIQEIFNRRGSMKSAVRLPRPATGNQERLLAFLSELSILTRSRLGLQIAAVGEYPYGAEADGVNKSRIRLHAILITGVARALASAELSAGDPSSFTEKHDQRPRIYRYRRHASRSAVAPIHSTCWAILRFSRRAGNSASD